MVRKSYQNTPNIDPEGGLEAAWEPPLCRGDPKTSCWTILAPLWDPIWVPVWVHVGHHLLCFLTWLLAGVCVGLGSIWCLFEVYLGAEVLFIGRDRCTVLFIGADRIQKTASYATRVHGERKVKQSQKSFEND